MASVIGKSNRCGGRTGARNQVSMSLLLLLFSPLRERLSKWKVEEAIQEGWDPRHFGSQRSVPEEHVAKDADAEKVQDPD